MDMPRLQWPSTRRRQHLGPAMLVMDGDGVLASKFFAVFAYEKGKVNRFNLNIRIPSSRVSTHQGNFDESVIGGGQLLKDDLPNETCSSNRMCEWL